MRRTVTALCLTVLAAITACGSPESAPPEHVPDDFTGSISYRNGSVPPPHHFEWTFDLAPDRVLISYRPGYDQATTPWPATIALTDEQRSDLYTRLRTAGTFDPIDDRNDHLAGGPTGTYTFTAAQRTYDSGALGRNRDSIRRLDAVKDAVTAAFPTVWDEFEQKQEAWAQTLPK